jgi:peptidoglycan-N-acetylglucosamine deacetylase
LIGRARPAVTFTLDLEEHRPSGPAPARYPDLVRRILAFLEERDARGTFFVVGDIAERDPGLVRDIAGAGHEIGFHGWRHVPLPEQPADQFRSETIRGKALLEDLAGREVLGFRAPIFSLVPESRWAVDVLLDTGFTYSSSVLPVRNPLFGDPSSPAAPFRWPNGLLELPCPVARIGSIGLPYLGGVYLRLLPRFVSVAAARRAAARAGLQWVYCHPYDFDPDEPYWVVPVVGRFGSRLFWLNRRHMFSKVAAALGDRPGPPLAERLSDFADAPLIGAP